MYHQNNVITPRGLLGDGRLTFTQEKWVRNPSGGPFKEHEMSNMTGFFSLLSEQQRDQILRNPQDFDIGDPAYLLIMDRAGSRKTGDSDETKTSEDSQS